MNSQSNQTNTIANLIKPKSNFYHREVTIFCLQYYSSSWKTWNDVFLESCVMCAVLGSGVWTQGSKLIHHILSDGSTLDLLENGVYEDRLKKSKNSIEGDVDNDLALCYSKFDRSKRLWLKAFGLKFAHHRALELPRQILASEKREQRGDSLGIENENETALTECNNHGWGTPSFNFGTVYAILKLSELQEIRCCNREKAENTERKWFLMHRKE